MLTESLLNSLINHTRSSSCDIQDSCATFWSFTEKQNQKLSKLRMLAERGLEMEQDFS